MPYIGKSPSFGVRNRFVFTPDAGATSVSGADANSSTLTFTDGAFVDVYLNGVLLKPTTDYNTNTANTIAGLTATVANDEVTVIVYDVFAVGDTVSAVNGGTFTGAVTLSGGVTGDLDLNTDSATIKFGADDDVTVTHDPDDGLILKSAATGDDNPFLLTLQTGETDLAANDVIGKIAFQAPDEGTGTDAILVSAAIQAVAEGDHSSSSNATKLGFMTGASEAATEKMSLSSAGDLTISRTADSGTVRLNLENTGTGGSSDYSEIKFNSTAGSTVTSIVQHRNNSGMNIGTTTDHPVSILQNNAAALTVNASGDIDVETGDIFFSGSGKGVNLGVTSNTDSNTLDDYEEGTYTVTMTAGSSGTITLNGSYNTGTYTKVGRLVHVAADVRISSVSSPNGTTYISLPFTALNNSKATSSNSIMTGGVTYQTNQDGPFFTRSLANTTTAEVLYDTNGNFFTLQAQDGGLGSSDIFSFSLTYMTE